MAAAGDRLYAQIVSGGIGDRLRPLDLLTGLFCTCAVADIEHGTPDERVWAVLESCEELSREEQP